MSVGPQFAMFASVLSRGACPAAGSNDLTGGVALPMFPAAGRRPDRLRRPKKADKSLGYHESCSGRIARQGENDQ
jgi:hypothetical protein